MIEIEKKDIHNRERAFNNAHEKLKIDETVIRENREFILRFVRDCRLGKTLKNRQKKVIGKARCLKYIQILKKLSLWLGKPFDQVTQSNMEDLIEKFENDELSYSEVDPIDWTLFLRIKV